jgi:DNA-binding PucR family transcriptional regulator
LLSDWFSGVGKWSASDEALLIPATRFYRRFLVNWFTMLDYGWAREYAEERESWMGSVQAMRAETARALLAGEGPDIVTASKCLRYELTSTHTAFVVWHDSEIDPQHPEKQTDLRAELVRRSQLIAESFVADQSIVLTLDQNSIGGWVSTAAHPPLRTIRSILKSEDSPPFRAAIGSAHRGLEGFRQSHEEALEARRVARLPGRTGSVVHEYQALSMTALATADLARAREFVQEELGPLSRQDDTSVRITSTLKVYFEELCNASKTARRLGLHKNTVLYRIQQAELLLGHRLDERAVELQLALALVRTITSEDPPSDSLQ